MVDFIACAMIKVGQSILLVKRQDNPLWSFPGGHIEGNEKPIETAIRATYEATGIHLTNPIEDSFCNLWFEGQFISLIPFRLKELNEVEIDTSELIDAKLFPLNALPSDCMETVYTAIQWSAYDEHDVAQAIAKGQLASPQYFEGNYLFDMRLTGTGTAKRNLENNQTEIAYRDPKEFLTKKFLNLCNGVRVVFDHPEKDNVDTEYLRNRQVGTVILPYVFDQEVWAIIKISSPLFSEMLMKTVYSTSPCVSNRAQNQPVYFDNNKRALYESSPYVVDHLAIVSKGVWDKDGEVLPGISTPINYINKNGAKLMMPSELEDRYNDLIQAASDKKRDSRRDSRRQDADNAFLEESQRKFKEELEFAKERMEAGDFNDEDREFLERAREQYETAKKEAEAKQAPQDTRRDRRVDRKDSEETKETPKKAESDHSISRDEMKDMFKELAMHIGEKVSEALSNKESSDPAEPPSLEDDKKKDACQSDTVGDDESSQSDSDQTDVDNKAVDALMQSKAGEKELTEEERTAISDCQQDYTTAYQMHGKRVPAPLPYETFEQYGIRAMSGVIQHSQKWNNYGLQNIRKDGKLLKMALGEVVTDAQNAAKADLERNGELRMTETHDGSRKIRSYSGSAGAFIQQFSTRNQVATVH